MIFPGVILAIIIIVMGFVYHWSRTDDNKSVELANPKARLMLKDALKKLNLNYSEEEDKTYQVQYQGEFFQIILSDKKLYLAVRELFWYKAPSDDLDNISLLLRLVNDYNVHFSGKIIYSYNKEKTEIYLHSVTDIMWSQEISFLDKYLVATFDTLLFAKNYFYTTMEEYRREQYAQS